MLTSPADIRPEPVNNSKLQWYLFRFDKAQIAMAGYFGAKLKIRHDTTEFQCFGEISCELY